MTTIYSYAFTEQGEGPWWGIRCPQKMYENMLRQMHETPRCFVYLTNSRGENLAIAVEGAHHENGHDSIVFVPEWVLARLGLVDGDTIRVEQILEAIPRAATVKIKPMTVASVESPIFLEGLTEALNQLGVIQEGLLSAIVDPSMPTLHEFIVEGLTPSSLCLADGDLEVDLVPAVDYVEPEPMPVEEEPSSSAVDFSLPMLPMAPIAPILTTPSIARGFVAFSGQGNRLG